MSQLVGQTHAETMTSTPRYELHLDLDGAGWHVSLFQVLRHGRGLDLIGNRWNIQSEPEARSVVAGYLDYPGFMSAQLVDHTQQKENER